MERKISIKCLGVLLDGTRWKESNRCLGFLVDRRLSWKEHKRYIKTNVAESISLLYKAELCANFLWATTSMTNLKSYRVIRNMQFKLNTKKCFELTEERFNSRKMLHIYKYFKHSKFPWIKFILRLLLQNSSSFFRRSLIWIQQCFQNCATRRPKFFLLNVNKEF